MNETKDTAALRARQQYLMIELGIAKEQVHHLQIQLMEVDRKLGFQRDLHPAGSSTGAVGGV
jgi:hypothetical protein